MSSAKKFVDPEWDLMMEQRGLSRKQVRRKTGLSNFFGLNAQQTDAVLRTKTIPPEETDVSPVLVKLGAGEVLEFSALPKAEADIDLENGQRPRSSTFTSGTWSRMLKMNSNTSGSKMDVTHKPGSSPTSPKRGSGVASLLKYSFRKDRDPRCQQTLQQQQPELESGVHSWFSDMPPGHAAAEAERGRRQTVSEGGLSARDPATRMTLAPTFTPPPTRRARGGEEEIKLTPGSISIPSALSCQRSSSVHVMSSSCGNTKTQGAESRTLSKSVAALARKATPPYPKHGAPHSQCQQQASLSAQCSSSSTASSVSSSALFARRASPGQAAAPVSSSTACSSPPPLPATTAAVSLSFQSKPETSGGGGGASSSSSSLSQSCCRLRQNLADIRQQDFAILTTLLKLRGEIRDLNSVSASFENDACLESSSLFTISSEGMVTRQASNMTVTGTISDAFLPVSSNTSIHGGHDKLVMPGLATLSLTAVTSSTAQPSCNGSYTVASAADRQDIAQHSDDDDDDDGYKCDPADDNFFQECGDNDFGGGFGIRPPPHLLEFLLHSEPLSWTSTTSAAAVPSSCSGGSQRSSCSSLTSPSSESEQDDSLFAPFDDGLSTPERRVEQQLPNFRVQLLGSDSEHTLVNEVGAISMQEPIPEEPNLDGDMDSDTARASSLRALDEDKLEGLDTMPDTRTLLARSRASLVDRCHSATSARGSLDMGEPRSAPARFFSMSAAPLPVNQSFSAYIDINQEGRIRTGTSTTSISPSSSNCGRHSGDRQVPWEDSDDAEASGVNRALTRDRAKTIARRRAQQMRVSGQTMNCASEMDITAEITGSLDQCCDDAAGGGDGEQGKENLDVTGSTGVGKSGGGNGSSSGIGDMIQRLSRRGSQMRSAGDMMRRSTSTRLPSLSGGGNPDSGRRKSGVSTTATPRHTDGAATTADCHKSSTFSYSLREKRAHSPHSARASPNCDESLEHQQHRPRERRLSDQQSLAQLDLVKPSTRMPSRQLSCEAAPSRESSHTRSPSLRIRSDMPRILNYGSFRSKLKRKQPPST